jgi:hypothetical protein
MGESLGVINEILSRGRLVDSWRTLVMKIKKEKEKKKHCNNNS